MIIMILLNIHIVQRNTIVNWYYLYIIIKETMVTLNIKINWIIINNYNVNNIIII